MQNESIHFSITRIQIQNEDMNQSFFYYQNTNTKCRHESICFSIARIQIQNVDMNQFVFPLPEYQYKLKTTVREPKGSNHPRTTTEVDGL
jgi:hypothetical protein